MAKYELTILLPCLNEEKNLPDCLIKANKFLKENNINGEVLVSDNGSTDSSVTIAKSLGASVINTKEKGYGNALINGIKKAQGKYIIMADSDDSYDFYNIKEFYTFLKEGYDLILVPVKYTLNKNNYFMNI